MTDTNQDSKALLSALIPFAKHQFAKRGTFLPLGAVVSVQGQVDLASVMLDPDSSAADMRTALLSMFQQRASSGEIRAAAVCYDGMPWIRNPGRGLRPSESTSSTRLRAAPCCSCRIRSGDWAAEVWRAVRRRG